MEFGDDSGAASDVYDFGAADEASEDAGGDLDFAFGDDAAAGVTEVSDDFLQEFAPEPEPEPEPETEPEPSTALDMDVLPDGWDRMNKEGLQDQCRERGLDDTGTKKELRERLQAWQDAQ
jgi:hypothetical protein